MLPNSSCCRWLRRTSQGFLLQADADLLITAAQASNVLNP